MPAKAGIHFRGSFQGNMDSRCRGNDGSIGAHRMTTRFREIEGPRDLLPLAAANPSRYPALLESIARVPTRARFDILFAFPQDRLVLDADGVLELDGRREAGDFLRALDREWGAQRIAGEFTVDVPQVEEIAIERRADAHETLKRWLAGDHTSNNTYR